LLVVAAVVMIVEMLVAMVVLVKQSQRMVRECHGDVPLAVLSTRWPTLQSTIELAAMAWAWPLLYWL
jgi:hypothetical protein